MSQEFFFLGRKGEVRTILSSPLNKENKTKTTTQQKTPQTTSFFPQESNLHVFPSQESTPVWIHPEGNHKDENSLLERFDQNIAGPIIEILSM